MRLHRTLTPSLFILCLLFWPALAQADFKAGKDAYDRRDYSTALKEWRPLADQGYANAQYNLGVLYEKGQGVPQDNAEAVRWWRLAAEQGVALAQANLGVMYYRGQGVPQINAEAARWWRLAAEQGDAGGQFRLAGLYYFGQGVAQDYVQAHMWANLAAAQNQKGGTKLRDLSAEKMTPEQIAKAQRLVREWKSKKAPHKEPRTSDSKLNPSTPSVHLIEKEDAIQMFQFNLDAWNQKALLAAQMGTKADEEFQATITATQVADFESYALLYKYSPNLFIPKGAMTMVLPMYLESKTKPNTIQLSLMHLSNVPICRDEIGKSIIVDLEKEMAPEFNVSSSFKKRESGCVLTFFITED